jgi:tetratricopeptide (TPR) repeat protein
MVRKSIGLFCFAALLVVTAAVILVGPALAFDRNDSRDCNQTVDRDRQIAGCTRGIKSSTSDRNRSAGYNQRGGAYLAKGDYDIAIDDFDKAIRLDPDEVEYRNRGLAYYFKGDYGRAIADYNEAIRINPKYAPAYSSRGASYNAKGEHDLAITDCIEAIRLDPKNEYARKHRGDAYKAKGDYGRAIADYTDAIRLNPRLIEAFTARGLAYEKIAEPLKARSDFNAALEIPLKDNSDKKEQDKARERLAALSDAPAPVVAATPSATTAVVVSTAPIAVNDHRIALVIGNSAYENVPALPNPERDARFVAETLKRIGFESVTVLTNLRKDALITALRNFAARAESADWAVVYYAGHGMEVGGINYLVPVDARIAADRDIGFEAVPLEQVLNAAERAKKLRLVILDACRDNPFASQMKRTLTVASRSVTRGLAAVEPDAGTLVVYAAKDGETAIDGDGSNSPFAQAFVKNLQTPGLEVRRLFDYVRDDVMEATGRKQKPFSYGSISGRQDFYFVAGR